MILIAIATDHVCIYQNNNNVEKYNVIRVFTGLVSCVWYFKLFSENTTADEYADTNTNYIQTVIDQNIFQTKEGMSKLRNVLG